MDNLSFSLLLIFLFSLVTMGLLKAQKKIMPKRYFHYGRLIDGLDEDVSFLGVLFRSSIPVITGLWAGWTALYFGYSENIKLVGASVGFFSAFCLVWPDYYNPELISPNYAKQKAKLYTLYSMVAVIFTVGGFLGAILATILFDIDTSSVSNYLDYKDIITSLVTGIVLAVCAGFFKLVAASFKREE
ncbi:hypothetical protein [Vibrio metschnikovii]|uniref:hypothetical protein n=1 Tax=Vibrio metschnikovii TaxID=28172 RepID=UPI001E2B76FE|nr:hypothetical protein [Vibrio metschnikovii]